MLCGNLHFVETSASYWWVRENTFTNHNMNWLFVLFFTDEVQLLLSFLLYIVPEIGGGGKYPMHN